MTQTDPNTSNVEQRPAYEELQVVGEQLLAKVKELLHEGNVRRIIIKQEGHTIMEFPLTVGVVSFIVAPMLAAIGAISALVTQCSIEVVRSERPTDTPPEAGA
jgi:DNA polymerase/3'-5' exonuclease PolX